MDYEDESFFPSLKFDTIQYRLFNRVELSMRKQKKSKGNVVVSPDARVQRSKQVVLTTTFELLTKEGFSGVTVDAVSELSGVAKTTIYRHWPSRSALLIATCSQLDCLPKMEETGTLRGDLMALATFIAVQLRTSPWAAALPSVIDAAERDPELAALISAMHDGRTALVSEILARSQKRGELTAKWDVAELSTDIYGPLFYRRWFSREPLTERFAKTVVEAAIDKRMPIKK